MPTEHSHLTGVVLEAKSITGDKTLDDTYDDVSFVLLVGKYKVRQFSMYGAAFWTSKTPDVYFGLSTVFRPYKSFHAIVVFKFTAAFRAS